MLEFVNHPLRGRLVVDHVNKCEYYEGTWLSRVIGHIRIRIQKRFCFGGYGVY